MSDKLRTTFPIPVPFYDGELPTSTKLNGLSRQARYGLNLMEYAIGDLWGQAGDQVLINSTPHQNALTIPNIARYLGQTRKISPRIPTLPNIEKYTFDFTNFAGEYEAVLSFPCAAAGTSFTFSGSSTPGTSTPETSKAAVDDPDKWYLNRETGYCFFGKDIQADWTLEYEPVVEGDVLEDSTFNIIPDMDTHGDWAFPSVKIQYVNAGAGDDDSEGYYIFLPPRGPLDTRRISRSAQSEDHIPSNTANLQASPSTGDRLFWQADTVAADTGADAEHYRYLLPKMLTDDWSQAVNLPTGFLYLWDPTITGSIIEGVAYNAENAATPRKWVFVAKGSKLSNWLETEGVTIYTPAMLADTTHTAAMYPTNGLRVITVGTSVSDVLGELVRQFLDHDHSTANSLPGQYVKHSEVLGLFDPEASSGYPLYRASGLTNDDHPQYLHRVGFTTSRDDSGGGMHGMLLMSSQSPSSNFLNLSADSQAVAFGHNSAGPKLFYSNGSNYLRVTPGSANGLELYGDSEVTIDVSASHLVEIETSDEMTVQSSLDLNLLSSQDVNITGNIGVLINGMNWCTVASLTGDLTLQAAGDWIVEVPVGDADIDVNDLFRVDASNCALVATAGVTLQAPSILLQGTNNYAYPNLSVGNDVTIKGRGGELWANKMYPGGYQDALYQYSDSANKDLGPVRVLHIPAQNFKVFRIDDTSGEQSAPDPSVWSPVWAASLDSSGYKTTFLEMVPSASQHTYAFAELNLPFRQWSIIQAQARFKTLGVLKASDVSIDIGQSVVGSTADFSGVLGGVINFTRDLFSFYAGGGSWSNRLNLLPHYTTTPLLDVDNTDYVSSLNAPWLRIRIDKASAIGSPFLDLKIADVVILYRIKEF